LGRPNHIVRVEPINLTNFNQINNSTQQNQGVDTNPINQNQIPFDNTHQDNQDHAGNSIILEN
jgi:hypothetical protein